MARTHSQAPSLESKQGGWLPLAWRMNSVGTLYIWNHSAQNQWLSWTEKMSWPISSVNHPCSHEATLLEGQGLWVRYRLRALSVGHSLEKCGNKMAKDGRFHGSKSKLDPSQDMKVSVKDSILKITQNNYFMALSTWNSHLIIIRFISRLINKALEGRYNSKVRPSGCRALKRGGYHGGEALLSEVTQPPLFPLLWNLLGEGSGSSQKLPNETPVILLHFEVPGTPSQMIF